MKMHKIIQFSICIIFFSSVAFADMNLNVLPETIDGIQSGDMMNQYLRKQARQKFDTWKDRYEERKTPDDIAEYQNNLHREFLKAIGGLPERTPLNPQVTGIVTRKGYRVEKVIFESQPKHFVSSLLFLPMDKKFEPPYPGVLVPCGHSLNGKGNDAYQTMGALLALNGMAGLVFDPLDQGERGQILTEWPRLWGTRAHTMLDVDSIPLGKGTASFMIWDGMRAIDYLQSRSEIDPNRIGCTGNSGGGTQTSYLMSLDDRITAAAPSCYITSFERLMDTIGGQDGEQNIYGQIGFGMDHADYLMMRAPVPILICAATEDFFDITGTWQSFRNAKRLYTRLEYPERIELMENEAGHNYNRLQRQSIVRWMSRWLLKKDEPIFEPDIELLTEEEYQCTPQGQVMLLNGARSAYDINRDYEKTLSEKRKDLWSGNNRAEMLNEVRRLAGIRKLAELPEPEIEKSGIIVRDGYTIRKMIIKPEDGIYLSALMFVPKSIQQSVNRNAVLYLHQKGKDSDANPGGPIEKLVLSGRLVLAVDLRGTGETQQTKQKKFSEEIGLDWQDVYMAFLLGRSYVGMRAEDVLVCARFLQQNHDAPVDLIAVGNVGVPALHAAALESNLFGSIELTNTLISWSNLVESGRSYNQFESIVYGALTTYDLPDLAAASGDKLVVKKPFDALGRPL